MFKKDNGLGAVELKGSDGISEELGILKKKEEDIATTEMHELEASLVPGDIC